MVGQWETRYKKGLLKLLNDKEICKSNRDLFKDFYEHQEYKLKRTNGLPKLDESSYNTLYNYINRLRNVNKWFKNKPLKNITKTDIQRVYDALEDGEITKANGKMFEGRKDYYDKIFKSKLFKMIGKDKISNEVMEFCRPNNKKEVRFIEESDFRKIVDCMYKPHHRLLIWLSFDIGENINSLLKLKKKDLFAQNNPTTKQKEYRVNLKKEILKRSRTARNEITNYNETVILLEQHLTDLEEEDLLFNFDYRNAKKIIDRAVERSKVKTIPEGKKVTWKDIRNSMACDLLKKGWSRDEVNARLGHRPSSSEIDKYINFLALDRHEPKKKLNNNSLEKIQLELEEAKQREKLQEMRLKNITKEMKKLRDENFDLKEMKADLERFQKFLDDNMLKM